MNPSHRHSGSQASCGAGNIPTPQTNLPQRCRGAKEGSNGLDRDRAKMRARRTPPKNAFSFSLSLRLCDSAVVLFLSHICRTVFSQPCEICPARPLQPRVLNEAMAGDDPAVALAGQFHHEFAGPGKLPHSPLRSLAVTITLKVALAVGGLVSRLIVMSR